MKHLKTLGIALSLIIALATLCFAVWVNVFLLPSQKGIVEDRGIVIPPKLSNAQKYELCMKDKVCRVLTEVGYYESRNQPDKGVVAVLHVVLNRVKHPTRWGNSVKEVVYAPWQFSYTHEPHVKKGYKDLKSKRRIAVLAWKVLNGKEPDPTNGADMYHASRITPKWQWTKVKKIGKIGEHVFYKHI